MCEHCLYLWQCVRNDRFVVLGSNETIYLPFDLTVRNRVKERERERQDLVWEAGWGHHA